MATGRLQGCLLDHYRVESLIGHGAMGEVYRAHDTQLDRAVALKVLPQDLVANSEILGRFLKEARTASALNHPHLVAIYQIGFTQAANSDVHYIAMELVEGATLRTLIESRRLDLKRTLDYMTQTADAISAAHAGGIVHRDLKPENLMVADRGYIKVLDFGLAKVTREAPLFGGDTVLAHKGLQPTAVHTIPGAILGTVGYMAPEQAAGRPTDSRADIFSFGCVLYEAVTGTRAFAGSTSVDTLHRILHEDPPSILGRIPTAPAELNRILRKCLSKDVEARYQSMKEVAIDLRNLRQELDSNPPGLSAPSTALPSAWFVALVVSIAIVVAALGWFARNRPSANVPAGPVRMERLTGSGNVIDATISPDGKYIAYMDSFGGLQGLWLRQLNGNQPLSLVPPAQVGFWGAQFTKDSSSIFYAIKAPGIGTGQLFQIPILGGSPRPILTGIDSTVSFSKDGKQIAYLRENFPERGASSLMIAGSDGTNPHPLVTKHVPFYLAPGFFIATSWSPDGSQITAGLHNSATRDAHLVTIDAVTGAERTFPTRCLDVSFTNWLPDGSGILYVGRPADRLTLTAGGQIWLQPFPEGAPKPLTTDLVDYRNVTVSADGQSIITVGGDIAPTLWIIPVDPKDSVRRLESLRGDGGAGLAWAPDGTILYSTRVAGRWQIARMSNAGTDRREVTIGDSSVNPQITRDGVTHVFLTDCGYKHGRTRVNHDRM